MCKWQSITFFHETGQITIPAQVLEDACGIIFKVAQNKQTIAYADVISQLQNMGHQGISKGTINEILAEVNNQISQNTTPSIYPSSIVIQSGGNQPGKLFWRVSTGTNPPSSVLSNQRRRALHQYQNDVFNRHWDCNC
jgi:hypothetical protein